jgi:hypothetical protein
MTSRPPFPVPWEDDRPQEPAGETPTELMQLLELQAALLIAVATGGPRIDTVNQEYQQRRRVLNTGLSRYGIEPPFPWRDLWGWYGTWQTLAGYAARRAYISQLAAPVHEQLERLAAGQSATDPGPATTNWPELERRVAGLHEKLQTARSPDDLQDVGRRAREILIDLAGLVYRSDMLPADQDEQPKAGDAKNRLTQAAAALMSGQSHDDWRKLIRAAWDLANTITHSTSINRVNTFAAVQATVLLVRTFEQAAHTTNHGANL